VNILTSLEPVSFLVKFMFQTERSNKMATSENPYIQRMANTFELVDMICTALGMPLYVVMARVGKDRSVISASKGVGKSYRHLSTDPASAYEKIGELIAYGEADGISLTPIGFPGSSCLPGGIRHDEDVVACADWGQFQNQLMSAFLMWSLNSGYAVRFHHVGFRHSSREAAYAAAQKRGGAPYERLAPDHLRWITWVPDQRTENGGYYIEDSFFPDEPNIDAFHIDVATLPSHVLLTYVAKICRVKPVFWESGVGAPNGMVTVTDGDNSLTLMARQECNKIE
jgi:hypothetical protein